MNNLIRERKGMLILSLLVILLPLGVGLFLWNQLPDQVPIHFGLNGQADNYAGKAFVVFGLPLLMAALQVLLLVVTTVVLKYTWYRPLCREEKEYDELMKRIGMD